MSYKRQMLAEMRLQGLHTPVSTPARDGLVVPLYDLSTDLGYDASGLKGGGRIVPLYESERLARKLEGSPRGQSPGRGTGSRGRWHWPRRDERAVSPTRPSTGWADLNEVASLSRLDALLSSPSLSRRAREDGAANDWGTPMQQVRSKARLEAKQRIVKKSASVPTLAQADPATRAVTAGGDDRPGDGIHRESGAESPPQEVGDPFFEAFAGLAAKYMPAETAEDRRAIPRLSYAKAVPKLYS